MKVAVINLARSRDRRELIESNLARLGVTFELFAGIDASRGDHVAISQYNEAAARRDLHRPMSAGEIGCFASHYLLWQRCVEAQEPLIVLEDDTVVDDGFVLALATASQLMPAFPLIRLGLTAEGAGTESILSLPNKFETFHLGRGHLALSVTSCLRLPQKHWWNTPQCGLYQWISILIAPKFTELVVTDSGRIS